MAKRIRTETEYAKELVSSYIQNSDWRVKENSNVGFSIGGLILHNSGAIIANYWLNEVYNKEIADAHRNASFHIHDLSMLSAYCAGWSLRQLVEEGLGGVTDKITSKPAAHLSTLCNQMVNFLGIMQNEWAGAQAFSSFDTYLAPFIKKDNLTDEQIRQALQSFVFGINTPSRWGTQAPFSNITLDLVCPDDLKDRQAVVDGEYQNFTYGSCQEEMNRLNSVYIDILVKGDANGRGFQYPIPTYNITKDFDWNSIIAQKLFEMAAKYGTPYFQNFINSDLNPEDVRSMCCRLQLDKRELRKRGGGLFGSDEFTGSIGVVTINLPQIAHLTESKEAFFARLKKLMGLAKDSLEIKRTVLSDFLSQGMYPYTKRYLSSFKNHFNTIGICGMNEACLNFLGQDITTTNGKNFAQEILDFMRTTLSEYQEQTGNLYNLEATPAESTSYRLAKHDKENYIDIITSGIDEPFYTNSSQLPVNYTTDIYEALDHQESLQIKYTGGTVFHTMLGERVTDWQACRDLVKSIAYNYKIPYFTISPVYSVCPAHGYLSGEHKECEICKQEKVEKLSQQIEELEKIIGENNE